MKLQQSNVNNQQNRRQNNCIRQVIVRLGQIKTHIKHGKTSQTNYYLHGYLKCWVYHLHLRCGVVRIIITWLYVFDFEKTLFMFHHWPTASSHLFTDDIFDACATKFTTRNNRLVMYKTVHIFKFKTPQNCFNITLFYT